MTLLDSKLRTNEVSAPGLLTELVQEQDHRGGDCVRCDLLQIEVPYDRRAGPIHAAWRVLAKRRVKGRKGRNSTKSEQVHGAERERRRRNSTSCYISRDTLDSLNSRLSDGCVPVARACKPAIRVLDVASPGRISVVAHRNTSGR